MTSIVTADIKYHERAGKKGHVVFFIEVSCAGKCWMISRRYNDFIALQRGFSREFPETNVGPLPKKSFFKRFDEVFLMERSDALQVFLANALVKIPVTNSGAMLDFLEVNKHVQPNADTNNVDRDSHLEEIEQDRLAQLVQAFADSMIDSQSVTVESRDDAEVEERREKLLRACNGFSAHDDHLKSFFNAPIVPNLNADAQGAVETMNTNNSIKEAYELMDQTHQALNKHLPSPLIMESPDGLSLVTHMQA